MPAGLARRRAPEIGTPADTTLTQSDEYQIGLMVIKGCATPVRSSRTPNHRVHPVHRLASRSHAQEGHRVSIFVVKDPTINAFALPGGFIGVNEGLILATANESELAGVLAHEIAHVRSAHRAPQSGRTIQPGLGGGHACGHPDRRATGMRQR